ncbi:hypothetical protein [Methanosarcina mazei]|uniref:hypothetical protein n=1 Tax=Methanosarcina mazei TaxID=2209 RepID=UPI0012D45A9A|nr:hypothetical protein [Methanosarcina mazei]
MSFYECLVILYNNPLVCGLSGGFIGGCIRYFNEAQFHNTQPSDYSESKKFKKISTFLGFALASTIVGGIVVFIISISNAPPIWNFVVGITSFNFVRSIVK